MQNHVYIYTQIRRIKVCFGYYSYCAAEHSLVAALPDRTPDCFIRNTEHSESTSSSSLQQRPQHLLCPTCNLFLLPTNRSSANCKVPTVLRNNTALPPEGWHVL